MLGEHHWGGLIWTLVRTDFKARYHGTLGGFVWALLKPLAMFVVLLSVFSLAFASDPAYKLNLLLGLFLWDYFSDATKTGILSMHAKGYLLTKTRFPAWIVIVTSTANALITLALFSAVLLAFLEVSGSGASLTEVALYVAYVLAFVAITWGIGLAGAVLFLRYRDLNQIWDLVTQAGFFVAPVIYPLSVIPERFHFALYLWPPTAVIQFSRSVLIDHRSPTLTGHAMLAVVTAVTVLAGLVVYRRFAPRALEHL